MNYSRRRVYLDHNATAPLRGEARSAMLEALASPANPSSVHQEGRQARSVVELARTRVADLVGARPADVIFTSGGTEANNLVLTPQILVDNEPLPAGVLLVSAVEHASVIAGGRFAGDQVETIPVDAAGRVQLSALQDRLARKAELGERPFVSVMIANNETGVLQPIGEIAEVTRAAGGYLHADAVQAAGRIALNPSDYPVDFLTLSAHKIGGPAGCGALIAYSGRLRPAAALRGGAQESRLRAGTENVAAIAGFGAAAKAVAGELDVQRRIATQRDRLETDLACLSPTVTIFGAAADRLGNTSCFAIDGLSAETTLIYLDLAGISVSSGSACSSGKVGASHVLQAMDVDEGLARCAIRVSFGVQNEDGDGAAVMAALTQLIVRAGTS